MRKEWIEAYIHQRLAELDKQKDMQEVLYQGKFSFGIDHKTFGHLPAWKDLVKQKKKLQRWIWIDAFCLALVAILFNYDLFEKFEQNWIKALGVLIVLAVIVMLFFVIGAYFSLFARFRHTERQIRKLIYQDILFQLNKEEKDRV